jgi:glutamyl-tRNA synthetase
VGGEMLLRIEDTDAARSQPELIQVIFDALGWLGIDWDGEVAFQSAAAPRHAAVVERFLADGVAYRCDCSQEEVQVRVKAAGLPQGYDGYCRDRDVSADAAHVVRFRVPDDGETSWDDIVRGTITFENRNLEDFVLRRRDGSPMFVVANAVDDADSAVTHVIRGEDLINVTPKMLLVRGALGVTDPVAFAHLPLIVGADRKKLSKRKDDVSLADYQAKGYLPEAMVNYLALLGWGPADGVEVRPVGQIIELFDLADVNPSPAMFDVAKLDSINGEYLRALSADRFVEAATPFVDSIPGFDPGVIGRLAPELQTRLKTLVELPELVDFFFDGPADDPASWDKAIGSNADAPAILDAAMAAYQDSDWDRDVLRDVTGALAEAAGLKLRKAQAPIRVAITGRTKGPPLFESLVELGREQTLERLRAARARC